MEGSVSESVKGSLYYVAAVETDEGCGSELRPGQEDKDLGCFLLRDTGLASSALNADVLKMRSLKLHQQPRIQEEHANRIVAVVPEALFHLDFAATFSLLEAQI